MVGNASQRDERHRRDRQSAVDRSEEPHGSAAEKEREGGQDGGPVELGPPQQERQGACHEHRCEQEIHPATQPSDERQDDQRPASAGSGRARVDGAQCEQHAQRDEDQDEPVDEPSVADPLQGIRRRHECQRRSPPPVAEDATGQERDDCRMPQRDQDRHDTKRHHRLPEERERHGVEIPVDRPHEGLPVEEERQLAMEDVPTHETHRGLVEPDGERGRGGHAHREPGQRRDAEGDQGPGSRPRICVGRAWLVLRQRHSG